MKQKHIILGLFILLITVSLCGCGKLNKALNPSGAVEEGSEQGRRNNKSHSSGVRSRQVKLKGNGEDTVTVLMYVNGSNLESEAGEATRDLSEAIKGAGDSEKVNFLVQTMGTKKWSSKLGISAKKTQRFKLDEDGLTLVDDSLKQLDCTKESTLADFIRWGAENYPADRYILIFWDHGAGSLYGFGYDECINDEEATLTLDEMQGALKSGGVFFDFIGMDCCIMATLETACAFYDYCDYTILCEDFESGLGWYYTDWVAALYDNTSIDTEELGTIICNDMIQKNIDDRQEGDDAIMSVIDEGNIKVLYQTWVDFAYANEDVLLGQNYSRAMKPKKGGRKHPVLSYYEEELNIEEYFEVDMMAAASSIDSDESEALQSALSGTIVYSVATDGDADMSGIAVTLPYGDRTAYSIIKNIFPEIGLDDEYVSWLGEFVNAEGFDDYYSYDDWNDSWCGWDSYDDDYDWDYWDDEYDDDYWDNSSCGFDDWDYYDSFNYYYDEYYDDDDWDYWDDDDWYYYDDDDDWYYDDDDDWYYDDDDDYYYDDDDDWYYDDDDDYYYDDDDDWYYDDDDDYYYDDWDDWDY